MASLRQILANQQNALRSTGPKTEEGKAIARRNALKHGLAGSGLVLPEDEAEAVNARWAQWQSSLRPDDAHSDWIVERIASLSIRLERCEHHERALLEIRTARASGDWDLESRLAAESLGESLPKAPARVALELRRSGVGRAWLATRWEALGAILDVSGTWDEAQRSLAMDLLGTPRSLRTGPTRVDAGPPALRTLVDAELAGIAAAEAAAPADADDLDRTAAELGFGPVDRELALARRYGRSLTRQIHEFRKQLKSAGHPYAPGGTDTRGYTRPPYVEPAPVPNPPGQPCAEFASRTAAAPPAAAAIEPVPSAADTEADIAAARAHAFLDQPAPRGASKGETVNAPISGVLPSAPPANRKARRTAAARARRA